MRRIKLSGILIPARRPDLVIVCKNLRTCCIEDFVFSADHWVKIKESEKRDMYLDIAIEVKKLWNLKVSVIPIVTGALGTIPKSLVKRLEDLEIRGRAGTIQTTALLR